MGNSWRGGLPAPLASLMLVLAMSGCAPGEVAPGEAQHGIQDPRGPVPSGTQQIQAFPCDSASMAEGGDALASLGGVLLANEVHDCQKLITTTGTYGPLVGVYPIADALAVDNATLFTSPRPVATLFNWGPGTYQPLGIRPTWTCIWLQLPRGDTIWKAFFSPPSASGCIGATPPDTTAGPALDVQQLRSAGVAIPRTARWGWDGRNRVQYIGIKCADRWCSIGPDGFEPRETSLGAGGRDEVPGWYDHQRLAIPDGSGGLVPGPTGKIYPAARLDDLVESHFRNTEREVAFVELTGRPDQLVHYDTLWNFKSPGRNVIRLINRTGRPAEEENGWFMIVRPPPGAGSTREFPVIRTPGLVHTVRGAVRWRWDSSDESGWFGCGDACCSPRSARH